jgi:hypothetical protein
MPPGFEEALLFALPVVAGVIGGKYLGKLGNFCLMMTLFQFELFAVASISAGRLHPEFLVPYTVTAIVPAVAGIAGSRYFSPRQNAWLIAAVFYISAVLAAYVGSGEVLPLRFYQAIFLDFSSLIPPLLFVLVARWA